jgi:hypothetical protein
MECLPMYIFKLPDWLAKDGLKTQSAKKLCEGK